jgi:hypothetical protein
VNGRAAGSIRIVFFDALRVKIRDANVVFHGMKAEPGCCARESDRWMH